MAGEVMRSKYFNLILVILIQNICLGQIQFLKTFKINQQSQFELLSPPTNSISHLVIRDSEIFIGTGKGLAKSTDGGRHWISFRNNPAFASDGIFAIAINQETVWTSTGYEKDVNDGSVQTGSGYTYSSTGDTGWIHIPQTLDSRSDSIISYCPTDGVCINDSVQILPILVEEQNVTFDIALTKGTVWIASWASGLRKSTDNGKHWERILLPLDNMNSISPTDTLWTYAPSHTRRIFKKFDPRLNNNLLAFSVFASGTDTIWCGTAGGVNRSTDGGKSWKKFNHQNQVSSILGNWVIAIKEQRFGDIKRIWTTNWKAQDPEEDFGVSYTDDAGITWKNLLHGVRAYDFAFKDSIAYIGTEEGIYRTADGGMSFIHISNLIDNENNNVIIASRVYAVGVIGDTVYLGTNEGFASTIDNANYMFGSQWKIYRTSESVGTSTTTYAYPNPFAPKSNLNDPYAYVRIHYGKDNDSNTERRVSIDIFDFGMNRVRTLLKNALRSTSLEYDELWDGRDDNGNVVANGVYFYMLRIDDNEPQYGKILILQ
jgi:photosystem II stability/assembly factor-like uncharacterized protein